MNDHCIYCGKPGPPIEQEGTTKLYACDECIKKTNQSTGCLTHEDFVNLIEEIKLMTPEEYQALLDQANGVKIDQLCEAFLDGINNPDPALEEFCEMIDEAEHWENVQIGDRIRFLKTLDWDGDEEYPGCTFAKEGDLGEILDINGRNKWNFWVKRDNWKEPFSCMAEDFEVI